MRMHALLLISAIFSQYGASWTFMDYYEQPELTSTQETAPVKVRPFPEARREIASPETAEKEALCLLSRERDAVMHLSCKQRLTRSKFNINPFGLRFGKRQDLLSTPAARTGTRKFLPNLLYLRDFPTAT